MTTKTKLRVKDDPQATQKQVAHLAKRDLGAALVHPNVPMSLLLANKRYWRLVLDDNPAWPLLALAYPTEARVFLEEGMLEALKYNYEFLLDEPATRTELGLKRLVAWGCECLDAFLMGYLHNKPEQRVFYSSVVLEEEWRGPDKRLQQARRAMLRWAIGLIQNKEMSSAAAQAMAYDTSNNGYGAVGFYQEAVVRLSSCASYAAHQMYESSVAEAKLAWTRLSLMPELAHDKVLVLTKQQERLALYIGGKVAWLEKTMQKVEAQRVPKEDIVVRI